jgi:hypothetical protein
MFCQIVFLQAYLQCQYVVGLRFRSAITGLVYRKVYNLFYIHHQSSLSFSLFTEFKIIKLIQPGNDYWRNCQSGS